MFMNSDAIVVDFIVSLDIVLVLFLKLEL